jgi:hypothetical protein
MSLWSRLRSAGSLRPQPRATTLVSIANSLDLIARGIKVIVQKEYGRDLDAPPPTRADLTRDVFEPLYPDDMADAVREEVERIERAAEEARVADAASAGVSPARALRGGLSLNFSPTARESAGEDDDMTPQEREFLAGLDTTEDER